MAAAPAPAKTTFTSSSFLPASSSAFRNAAAEMIARSVLVVVEDGDLHPRLELLLDVEALGRLDVLEVDAAERGLEAGDALDELVGVLLVDLDVEDVDVGEPLEEDGLSFHDGLAGRAGRCRPGRARRCRSR